MRKARDENTINLMPLQLVSSAFREEITRARIDQRRDDLGCLCIELVGSVNDYPSLRG